MMSRKHFNRFLTWLLVEICLYFKYKFSNQFIIARKIDNAKPFRNALHDDVYAYVDALWALERCAVNCKNVNQQLKQAHTQKSWMWAFFMLRLCNVCCMSISWGFRDITSNLANQSSRFCAKCLLWKQANTPYRRSAKTWRTIYRNMKFLQPRTNQ